MMECDTKVFKSNIIRDNNTSKNNLYDIVNVIPVQPLPEKRNDINTSNEFLPKCDKFYVPKKKNSRKVKTVRDIRNAFERDVYSYLPAELEKQRNLLLRKIRYGTCRDEKTKEFAYNLLKSDSPLSKTAWQMLMNINPEGHKCSSQYVLWNGKCIQVNGSKGGQHKFICNHDIGNFKKSSLKKTAQNSNILTRKRQLLHRALNVKFKPGPLTKKYDLDVSYQKYQFGKMELVTLPKTGIEVHTSYGKPLAPIIDTFITKSFFENDGLITQQWATFAVSVLGKNQNGIVIQDQDCDDSFVAFDLNYKCFQNKILMRRDNETNQSNDTMTIVASVQDDTVIFSEVTKVLEDILNAVEISLMQDDMYTGVDELRETKSDHTMNAITHINNKSKRNGELRRLDVTVITISETTEPAQSVRCQKDYCTFGCVCDALKCSYNLKGHCGRIECMFKCTCDFSKYKYKNSFDNHNCDNIIPDLINLDKTLSKTLAKEEHKFHQTVIVTNEKSIVLKSNKRNWKASKKYADFYSDMPLKTESNTTQMLSIICPNLDSKNIEPWCMVHNLYKCFCKGKFEETGLIDLEENKIIDNENAASQLVKTPLDVCDIFDKSNESTGKIEYINAETKSRLRRFHRISCSDKCNIIEKSRESTEKMEHTDGGTKTRTRLRKDSRSDKYIKKYNGPKELCLLSGNSSVCARIQPYGGRKYRDEYYKLTNDKISEMEKNDMKLQKKMINLMSGEEDSPSKELLMANEAEKRPSSCNEMQCDVTDGAKRMLSNTELVLWLEKSYKQYKERADLGLIRLDAPKPGKLCLYAWDFILSRYRERKNYFLITKKEPFRTFIAVNMKNAFFDNCINISDIVLSDIDKYPITVKNLLTNATEPKDNYCIFRGLAYCWELIGSVKKVNKELIEHQNEKQIQHLNLREDCSQSKMSHEDYNLEDLPVIIDDGTHDLLSKPSNELSDPSDASFEGKSKWFVMKVKNDFTEIQFIEKGFFVKYDSIIKAINVARVSGKTVRLSSHKCSGQQNDPQFGIYAIPITEDCCVFIGPYEVNENLGIEAIKNMQTALYFPECRSGGIWKTCEKDDNLILIDNPLLFLPPNFIENKELISLFSDVPVKSSTNKTPVQNEAPPSANKIKVTACKQVKPIKIRKTNGFYHLTPNGCLKPIPSPEKDLITSPLLLKTTVGSVRQSLLKKFSSTMTTQDSSCETSLFTKPIAEIAPQIKKSIEKVTPKEPKSRPERGMFVLKPEEINKRVFEKTTTNEQQPTSNFEVKDEITLDIEKFLATSVICAPPPTDEVCVISDDDEEENNESIKNVWIVCTNIEKLGWIAGKKTSGNCISFEFPGFKSSAFYPEHEAMKKINQILARKVYVPRHIELQWKIVESEAEVKTIKKLEAKSLLPNFILTKRGLQHKFDISPPVEPSSDTKSTPSEYKGSKIILREELLEQKTKIMSDLEETSLTLEEESSYLWDETISRRSEIIETFSEASEARREELTEQLNCIISGADYTEDESPTYLQY